MNLKQVFSGVLLFFVLAFGVIAQETENQTIPGALEDYPELLIEYEELLNDYETLLDDYETLLDDYDTLLIDFNELSDNYSNLLTEFEQLDTLYEGEIVYHENSIKALNVAYETIEMLEESVEDLLGIVDTRYMTLYGQAGYLGTQVTGGIGFTIDVPQLPVSFMVDLDYIHQNEMPINVQVGVGLRF